MQTLLHNLLSYELVELFALFDTPSMTGAINQSNVSV